MTNPKPGDKVEIKTTEGVVVGILMPTVDLISEDAVIVKLSHGYNIGIDKKKIKSMKVLEAYKPKKEAEKPLPKRKGLPDVAILSTGGTISSKIDYKTGGVYADYTARDFVQMCPELAEFANLNAKKVMAIMSEDMTSKHWKKMAESAAKEINSGAEGVILTQGTDTMHFSTAALSFFLRGLGKPVIFTAAQRSIDRGSTDAFMNLICSVASAAKFDAAEVMTCMHGNMSDNYCILNRGTKVRKMHTSRRDAFRPVNEFPFAKVWTNGKFEVLNKNYHKKEQGEVKLDTKFEDKVALITIYPGMQPDVVDYYIDKKYKGIVLAATALGHVPTLGENTLIPSLKRAHEEKIPVIVSNQTIYGEVHPYVYSNLRKVSIESNGLYVGDMLSEVAYIKLGWVLGHTQDYKEVRDMMLKNIAGEISERIDPRAFLY